MESVEVFAARAGEFLREALPPRVDRAGHWGQGSDEISLLGGIADERGAPTELAAREWQRRKNDAGYGWITGPTEHGGAGLTLEHEAAFRRLERQYAVPDETPLALALHIVRPTLAEWGRGPFRDETLRRLNRGELVVCQLFSEPEAGSDLANVRTAARREGDAWVVNGRKLWSSAAHIADLGLLICRTGDPEARRRNLTVFLIDMNAPGITVRQIRQPTGKASFNEVVLDDVVIPDERRVGEVDGGWQVVLSTLTNERAAVSAGSLSNAIDFDLLLATVRRYGADDALTRELVGQAVVARAMSECYSDQLAAAARQGGAELGDYSVGKLLYTEYIRAAARLVEHALGPLAVADTGQWGTYAWRLLDLEIPAYSIGGGSDEMQRNSVAERLLGLPR